MKLKLNKEELVTLSEDAKELGEELTPQVGGGHDGGFQTNRCDELSMHTQCTTDNTCQMN